MPLLELWKSNPDAVGTFTIEQIVTTAGDGHLNDRSICSVELRKFLSVVPSSKLFNHLDRCLSASFPKSGFVLQDIVNELGRRLDYQVESGLYQGRPNAVGFDGLWTAPDGHKIVVEVKTTDAYRINLDTIARYRDEVLTKATPATRQSSLLIVVGRQDTGDLEAQIRGSRHAWDTRIISVDALKSLVTLKEGAEEEATITKIRSLLIPFEYTRLDNIIDVMFTAARDVEAADEPAPTDDIADGTGLDRPRQSHTPRAVLASVRQRVVAAMARKTGTELLSQKRALYADTARKVRVACSVSKPYDDGAYYWYAYHPAWDEFLEGAEIGVFVLGCVDRDIAYAIPHAFIKELLPFLNATTTEDGKRYWHVIAESDSSGRMSLFVPKRAERISLSPYEVQLEMGN
jgi:hypothetical protein